MFERTMVAVAMALAACAVVRAGDAAQAQQPPRLPTVLGGFPSWQVIGGVPEFKPQKLRLVRIPKPVGPRVALFDGKDLKEFTPWLGYANGTMFPTDDNDRPLGETGMGDQFRIVEEEGQPAIYIAGKIWGSINTRRDLANYHLHVRFKYGRQWSAEVPHNSGVLFHSYGPYGAFSGTWMSAIEFELQTGAVGMMIPIGRDITTLVELGKGPGPGLFGGDNFYYMRGGKPSMVRLPTPVRQANDVEKPLGQWNDLDLFAADDQAVFLVNGVPVMAVDKLARKGRSGGRLPLTHGRVQFESEGAEVYISELWFEPIRSVPRITAED